MQELGLSELIEDPERAEAALWSRRGLLRRAGVLGGIASMPFARWLPAGFVPVALAQAASGSVLAEKPGLRLLNDRPVNAETPAHLLDDAVTPVERMFVRNNGVPPVDPDPVTWRLEIRGESAARAVTLGIDELKRLDHHTYQLQLECGGNGRAEFRPQVSGNQWTTGAIACPRWTGVRIRDVLEAAGIRDGAVYVAYRGGDTHLSGDPAKRPISRGVPLAKALEDESLIAWALNDEPIPLLHGGPLRMVCGGWPGSVSGKWLTELLIRDRVHDGAKMGGHSYRVPCRPVAPGRRVDPADMCIIESMPVKSLITFPASGIRVPHGAAFEVRGHAWAGDLPVAAMVTSIDFGATWQPAMLEPAPNRLAWQRWRTRVTLPQPGYYEIWARATDSRGRSQPMLVPGWNPRGYLNNAAHRIAVVASDSATASAGERGRA